MNRENLKMKFPPALLITAFVFALITGSCNNPIGFGGIIDFEPPNLILAPGPNPRYMRAATTLSGTVTDNSGVSKIICREDTDTKRQNILGTGKISGSNWTLTLDPAAVAKTGKTKILAIIEAVDLVGNWSEGKPVTMIIDMTPPLFTNGAVQRTRDRPSVPLRPFSELKELETSDPKADNKDNVDLYQNGTFWIKAEVSDAETSVIRDYTYMAIYDVDHDNEGEEVYYEMAKLTGSAYAPEWLVKEEDLIAAGESKNWNYRQRIEDGQRLYFRVSFIAEDRAENRTRDDFGCFCLYREADKPRVRVETWVGDAISPGTPVPVTIFDDDYLETAYVDLLKLEQWQAYRNTAVSDEAALKKIEDDLLNGIPVYNWWKEPPHNVTDGSELVVNKITGTPETTVISVQAGTDNRDCGEYVIIAIVTDRKGDPHIIGDVSTRPDPVTSYYTKRINLVDNNAPIIVIDTVDTNALDYDSSKHPGFENPVGGIPQAATGNSPEENTFPINLEDHRYFTINGYILDENSTDRGQIDEFKIAWIPFGIEGGQDANVEKVKLAMEWEGTPEASVYQYPEGVQYWTLGEYNAGTNNSSYVIYGTEQSINETEYSKRTFKKHFDILGESPDDLKPEYNNFHFDGKLENAPKLFVLYAKDMDGHITYRTIRLLGNNNPPLLKVYNFTEKSGLLKYTSPDENDQEAYYTDISSQIIIENEDAMGSFKTFPRNTILKLYAKAEAAGDIEIESLKMYDITYENLAGQGFYNEANRDLTYITSLPDVTQRVFLFTAVNKLGVEASIQRTVAVTTTASLEEIITPKPSATYGIDTEILLQAHFAGTVKVLPGPGDSKPLLNIYYELNGSPVYEQVEYSGEFDKPTMYMEFLWKVPENANGQLKSVDVTNGGGFYDRPIELNGARIVDAVRSENAFLPGGGTGYGAPLWENNENSLQANKIITLDGVKPVINSFTAGGKNPYDEDRPNHLYFKTGETITFTLTASKTIRTSGDGNPQVEFKIKDPLTDVRISETSYFANYVRPAGNSGMFFEVDVDKTKFPVDGIIEIIGINTAGGGIEDSIGNQAAGNIASLFGNHVCTATETANTENLVAIDQTKPPTVTPKLFDGAVQQTLSASEVNKFSINPRLQIDADIDPADEPWGAYTQYSLNNGVSWEDSSTPKSGWTTSGMNIFSGQWKLRARSVDFAGNESEPSGTYDLDIRSVFPKLISISAEEPDGIKLQGPITINLDFDDAVYTTQPGESSGSAYIVVSDIAARSRDFSETHTAKIYVNLQSESEGSSTLSFTWNPITNKMMESGLMVTEIHLSGDIMDSYGNTGINSGTLADVEAYISGNPGKIWMIDTALSLGRYDVTNLNGKGLKVYTIAPKVIEMSPRNANDPDYEDTEYIVLTDRNKITIQYDQNMRAETGIIYIRPYGDYPIPPVFPAEAQTLSDGTYIESFYEVFSSGLLNADDREALLAGDGSSNKGKGYEYPATDSRTGQYSGPYKLTTQGLVEGPGFAANNTAGTTPTLNEPVNETPYYTIGASTTHVNPGWYPQGSYMVPDTSSKYVLDYQYSINDTGTVVTNIRKALNKAHYRWREIDVISASVKFEGSNTSGGLTSDIIEITVPTLNEGMKWELYIPEGAFTNIAGNRTNAIGADPSITSPQPEDIFWFWTKGVQAPVIRVDRKSLDNRRTVNKLFEDGFTHGDPTTAPAVAGGVGPSSFDVIKFKTESETPGAVMTFGTLRGIGSGTPVASGQHQTYNNGGILADWEGTISGTYEWDDFPNNTVTNFLINNITNFSVTPYTTNTITVTADPGTWVLPNLLRKSISDRFVAPSGNGPDQNNYGLHFYTEENGFPVKHQGMGNLQMYRSYNKDATLSQLNGLSLGPTQSSLESEFSATLITGSPGQYSKPNNAIDLYMASKNYVTAQASITHADIGSYTAKGYEGVFKTVVMLPKPNDKNNSANQKPFLSGQQAVAIVGSSQANGSPSIAGFPILPGSGDMRYIRIMARDTDTTKLLWASTEIVSPAFFQMFYPQNFSDLQSTAWTRFGDSGINLTGGYGDLTYSVGQM